MLVYTRFYNEADDLLFVTRPVYNIPSEVDLEDEDTTPEFQSGRSVTILMGISSGLYQHQKDLPIQYRQLNVSSKQS